MDVNEIREIAINSTEVYYKYLDENNKGIQEVDVFDIEYLKTKDFLIKLQLSAKLFDTEAIFFRVLKTNKKYDIGLVKVIEYDSEKNILLIKPTEDVANDFKDLRTNDIKVVSDLKFLVQRVKSWYELNGATISLPSTLSIFKGKVSEIKFIETLTPSKEQILSLKNIFENPFTYIWGAPGTGKTQFVLSYAAMHYISKNKRVAIIAPTNNSLEQVLIGVLKMTDKAGLDRKQLLRLGTPSRRFAEKYPEVCEEKGVQKKLEEIDKQIDILERILTYSKKNSNLKKAEETLSYFKKMSIFERSINEKKENLENAKVILKKKEIDFEFLLNKIKESEKERKKAQRHVSSLFNRISKLVDSRPSIRENNLKNIDVEIVDLQKLKSFIEYELSNLEEERGQCYVKYENELKTTNAFLERIKLEISKINEIKDTVEELTIRNWKEAEKDIRIGIDDLQSKLEIDNVLSTEYNNYSVDNVRLKLDEYQLLRDKLANLSTKERLTNVKVISCTLDGYIGRFSEEKLNVDHIFMDEAGYSNIIKALTLFNNNVPITFLGDHMQLPPVCEIADYKIETEEKFHNMFLWSQSSIYIEPLFSCKLNDILIQYLQSVPAPFQRMVKTSLSSTYRFGDSLARILAKHVYGNSFSSYNINGDTKIFFKHASKSDSLKSRTSSNEVMEICKIVTHLMANRNFDFAILTPYLKQVKSLGKELPQERNDLKILTVHGSQGREWHTVILSVVDTSDMWFVDSKNKMSKGLNLLNTALSRAIKQLIIVCDVSFWRGQDGQLITDLINTGIEFN
jgi:hypothetical protein